MSRVVFGGFILIFSMAIPEIAWAFGGFESRMNNLTNQLISVVLPLMSVLGLIYAVFLSVTGSGEAKGKIYAVLACSAIGFMAPQIIAFIQSAAG